MNRRDFLDPRHAAQTAGNVLAALDPISTENPCVHQAQDEAGDFISLVRYSRRAMGTVFEIVFPFGGSALRRLAEQALDMIDDVESQLTVYRETSEVSRLNVQAAQGEAAVSESLFRLLELSLELSESTQGAFDITAGALVEAWGFLKGPRRVPDAARLEEALRRSGWRKVKLDVNGLVVRFAARGLQINLGSIGKGYALDVVAGMLADDGRQMDFLLHGGKSSVLGRGAPFAPLARSGDKVRAGSGWPVALEHPWEAKRRLGTVYLKDRAMATSAATYKHLVHEGKKLGHILDPRTGWPASGIASATALAPTAAEADALATAFYILGVEGTSKYCQTHPNVGAVLLREGKTQLECFNLRSGELVVEN
jgi:thiamine biosynthesis lipoprotein